MKRKPIQIVELTDIRSYDCRVLGKIVAKPGVVAWEVLAAIRANPKTVSNSIARLLQRGYITAARNGAPLTATKTGIAALRKAKAIRGPVSSPEEWERLPDIPDQEEP